MNNDFDIALKYALRFEGGYVNDPLDSGGATNRGVTQKVYDHYRLTHGLSVQSVSYIKDSEVVQIYHQEYWLRFKCDQLPTPLSIAVFDFCVNSGSNGIKKLQQCLGITADGVIGNGTLGAVTKFCTAAPQRVLDLTKVYQTKRRQFYYGIVARKPSQVRFIKGWTNRVNQLNELIGIA